MPSLYLLINFFAVLIPFIFSYHPKLNFYKHFKAFFISNIVVIIPFLIWDSVFTHWGVWGFNPLYLTGVSLFNLPIEEVLFFICIPFACVYTYHCLSIYFKMDWGQKADKIVVPIAASIFLLIGFINISKLYTASTFISLGIVLFVLKYWAKAPRISQASISYLLLLLPFTIVNGLLTGTGIESEVVWYNDAENLGIRLLTIPVEDIFYGYELILLNIYFYELFKKRFEGKSDISIG